MTSIGDSLKKTEKQLALISLGLGFLLIWTSVLSGVLLTNTFQEDNIVITAYQAFNTHQDISRIVFELGREMLTTVEWFLTKPNLTELNAIKNGISIAWNISDDVINSIENNSKRNWLKNFDKIFKNVTNKLNEFRLKKLKTIENPIEIIHFYLDLCEQFKLNWEKILTKRLDYFYLPKSFISYNLFNDGMAKRFAEISIGTMYVGSNLPLDNGKYFYLHYTSEQLFHSAFDFNLKGEIKYKQLYSKETNLNKILTIIGEDILAGNLNRGTKRLQTIYLGAIKQQLSSILFARDILNTTLTRDIKHITSSIHNEYRFHISLTVTAAFAILLCLTAIYLSYRYVQYRGNSNNLTGNNNNNEINIQQTNQLLKANDKQTAHNETDRQQQNEGGNIYSLTLKDKNSSSNTTTFTKPQCYL